MELMDIQITSLAGLKFLLFLSFLTGQTLASELISHKGAHNEECYRIDIQCRNHCLTWNKYQTIENTIPSIREAFNLGAQRVEIDLQLSHDNEVMVFHDDNLFCKTGQDIYLTQLKVKELKKIDISSNLKFTNLEYNPFLGKGVGLMPTLEEVLTAFPGKGFLLNPKTENPRLLKRLNEVLAKFTENRKTHKIEHFSMWGPTAAWKSLKKRFPNFGERFSHAGNGNPCEYAYESYGWSGYFPPQCKGFNLALTEWKLRNWNLWGGPLGMLQTFHQHGSKIYLLHLKTNDEVRRFYTLQFDGFIITDIKIIQ